MWENIAKTPAVHVLAVEHRKKRNSRTALIFAPGYMDRERLPEIIPPHQRDSIPSGWVVEDAAALLFVRETEGMVCPACIGGSPCEFARTRLRDLELSGWTIDSGMNAANMIDTAAKLFRESDSDLAHDLGMLATGARVGVGVLRFLKMLPSRNGTAPKGAHRGAIPVDEDMRGLDPEQRAARILKVSWPCSRAQIKTAFTSALHTAHPDKGGNDKATRRAVEARNVLMEALNAQGAP